MLNSFDSPQFKQAVAEEAGYLVAKGLAAEKAEAWARVNVIQGVSNRPRAVVEYATKGSGLADAAIQKFYDECRARGGAVFVGD